MARFTCSYATLLTLLAALIAGPAFTADTALDLADSAAWTFGSDSARIDNGELVLDGRQAMARAFYLPLEWGDGSLKASFQVDPQDHGVLACGFVVRAADASHYYYVHFDKTQAILCRSDKGQSWNEIARAGGLDKPAGAWHTGELRFEGDTLRVFLNGAKLFEAKDATLKQGRIGFYANQGRARVKDITVSGAPANAEHDFTLPAPPPPDFTYVCTDAGAGGYEAFPDVCRLSDGRLMCVFYAGYDHVALPNEQLPKGGRISYCLSSDEGRTWTEARTLFDGPDDDRDPSIVQLASGRLICNFFSLRRADGASPPWTGLGTWMVYSDDLGATWSESRQITAGYYCSSPIRELSDGRLALGLYKETDSLSHGAVVFSEDGGMTWGAPADIDNNGMPLDAETDLIELKDGTLHAAQRSAGDTMAWSESRDGGKTWSVSAPYGFPGHAPYLHRTLNDVILLAHRLPQTSLHYSLDEADTWSENVFVDDFIGAYPSMVNLKDGTVLIVYYEEGAGSNIRAKRFLANSKGIHFMPVDRGVVPGATLVDYARIWDEAPHNAFTNLIRFQDRWFCVFREGQGHVSADGALRVITSENGETWTSAARITSETADLRDAQICITPDNRLMLTGAAALHQPADARHQTMAYFSEDGFTWTEGVPIGEKDLWLWRVTWHGDTAYGIGYSTGDKWPSRFTRLYKSDDGVNFEVLVDKLRDNEYTNESQIVFAEDGTAWCLLRRDEKAPRETTGLFGTAQPPYTDWTWRDTGARTGGPAMIQIPDGRLVAAVRLYDERTRTSLCWIDPDTGKLTEFLALPSGGDTSYPGLVWHDGLLWVSYYASHEGKTSIYLARVRID
ncbi:MAG: exo-alpha-sialidase [Candidatus Hydrogenedentes bacterium]|nr:exo-alpha-sialidase [Candidatus Hydrogenedentota bacterium]